MTGEMHQSVAKIFPKAKGWNDAHSIGSLHNSLVVEGFGTQTAQNSGSWNPLHLTHAQPRSHPNALKIWEASYMYLWREIRMPIIRMEYLMSSFWSAMPNLSKLYHPIGATMEKCAVNLQIGVPKKRQQKETTQNHNVLRRCLTHQNVSFKLRKDVQNVWKTLLLIMWNLSLKLCDKRSKCHCQPFNL